MKKIAPFMPMLMTFLGMGIISYKVIPLLIHEGNTLYKTVILIFSGIYALWMLYESRVTRGELKKDAESNDNSTMEIAAVVKISLLVSFFCGDFIADPKRIMAGFAIAIAGILFRCYAIKVLADLYSHRIRIPVIIRINGPYKLIRHPAYLGTALAHTGFTVVFFNIYSCILLFAWYGVVILRTITEERVSQKTQVYKHYSEQVKFKLIPFIW